MRLCPLLLFLLSLCAASAVNLVVPVTDQVGTPVTNVTVVLQMPTDGLVSSTNFIIHRNITNRTDTAGLTTFSNVAAGPYTIYVYATARGSWFSLDAPNASYTTNALLLSNGTNLAWTSWAAALTTASNALQSSITAGAAALVSSNALVVTLVNTVSNYLYTNLVALRRADVLASTNTVTTNLLSSTRSDVLASTNRVTTNLLAALRADVLASTNTIATNARADVLASTNTVTSNYLAAVGSATNFGGITTNLSVIVPGPATNTIHFTNGVAR